MKHSMAFAACGVAWVWVGALSAAEPVAFGKTVVDTTFRAEGVAVGDVNKDGKMDILSGDVWYEAPDWKMHEVRKVGKYNYAGGYSNCFANFAMDVNGDGWVDSIVIGFPGQACLWYENPQNKPGHWKQRKVCNSACNETPIFPDLLGDGKGVPLFGSDGKMTWYSVPKDLDKPWDAHPISKPKSPGTAPFSHGLGCGDVNGDGRNDVLIKEGWWEAPEDRTQGDWKFHPARLGPDCADLLVYDVDGDGLNDVITSSAHNFGMWWHKQTKTDKGIEFKQIEIGKSFSQTHAMHLVDVNGDGVKDVVTGKRYYAHNGHDPGGKDPKVLVVWFELRRPEKGKAEFVMHEIDDDSGVGTQFAVADMNGDGKPDIVTSNKKGVRVFVQK